MYSLYWEAMYYGSGVPEKDEQLLIERAVREARMATKRHYWAVAVHDGHVAAIPVHGGPRYGGIYAIPGGRAYLYESGLAALRRNCREDLVILDKVEPVPFYSDRKDYAINEWYRVTIKEILEDSYCPTPVWVSIEEFIDSVWRSELFESVFEAL